MNSKITLLLSAIIILFTGGCQNNTVATISPTPTILTTPTQTPLPEAVIDEPEIVSSPEVLETSPPTPTLLAQARATLPATAISTQEAQVPILPASPPTVKPAQEGTQIIVTPTSIQTQIDQYISAPLPTVVTVTSLDLTTVDTLADGLKLVYAETDGPVGVTKIWMSNVTQLDKHKLLVEVGPHKPGYSSGGQVSPDGSRLFYAFIPPDFSEMAAREIGDEIWVFDIESRTQIKATEAVNGFTRWTPDSQAIIYSKEKYDNINEEAGIQIYLNSIDNQEERLVFSTKSPFQFIGFLDTQTVLYLEGKSEILTETKTLDLISGETRLLQKIDVPQPWDRYSISPDGTIMLISRLDLDSVEKKYELITVSLNTGKKETIATFLYDERAENNPIYRPKAKWLLDSQSILIHFPPRAGQPAFLGLTKVTKEISPQPFLDNTSFLERMPEYSDLETFLIPGNWSSDGKWLTLLQYPRTDRDVYLLETATNRLTRLPPTTPSHWINIMGWTKEG